MRHISLFTNPSFWRRVGGLEMSVLLTDKDVLKMLTQRKKQNIIKKHQSHETDTGSAQVQIALTSKRIDELAAHLKKHPKDDHSRRGLLGMVNRRRKFLRFLSEAAPNKYKKLIKDLGLKK